MDNIESAILEFKQDFSEAAILAMLHAASQLSFEDLASLNQDLTFDFAKKRFSESSLTLTKNNMKSLGFYNAQNQFTNVAFAFSDQFDVTVKVARFKGLGKMEFLNRKEIGGSILDQDARIFEYLEPYNSLPAKIVGQLRVEQFDYPQIAIRELISNMLVHRDYSIKASSFINVFDDRMEFLSVGGLVPGADPESIVEGVSVARNPKISNIFYRLKIIEAYGTGIPRVFESFHPYGLTPSFSASDANFRITIPNTNYAGQDSAVNQPKLSGKESEILNEISQVSIKSPSSKSQVTRKSLQNSTGYSQQSVRHALETLESRGMIEKLGSGRSTSYQISKSSGNFRA